jgi:CrcB protein
VALGAAIGANGRFWIGVWAKAHVQAFPWPTLLINLLGSALLGAFSAAALERGWGWQGRLFFAVGLCGGFTTFSTFSYEVIDLYYERSWRVAGLYAVLSLVLCVAGCYVGGHFGRIAFAHSASEGVNGANPFEK